MGRSLILVCVLVCCVATGGCRIPAGGEVGEEKIPLLLAARVTRSCSDAGMLVELTIENVGESTLLVESQDFAVSFQQSRSAGEQEMRRLEQGGMFHLWRGPSVEVKGGGARSFVEIPSGGCVWVAADGIKTCRAQLAFERALDDTQIREAMVSVTIRVAVKPMDWDGQVDFVATSPALLCAAIGELHAGEAPAVP